MSAGPRVVAFGDVNLDVVALASGALARGSDTPSRIRIGGGGSAANVAAWLGALGAPAAFVGRVGDDLPGRALVDGLRDAGVDVRAEVDPERPTGTCVVLVEPGGERTMLPDPGANDAPAALPADLAVPGGHLHVVGYALLRRGARPGALDAIALARAAGMTVSVDPSSAALLSPDFLALADGAGLLVPNADETRALTGEPEPERAALRLATGGREVVVTLGAGGALWTDGDRLEHVPAAVADVVDTTGAGDAFAAGLLAARAAGADPVSAVAAGCEAAGRAVAVAGARPATA